MVATGRAEEPFAHRENEDGTFDSICMSCFRTVGSAEMEASLADYEKAHSCRPEDFVRFRENDRRLFRISI